MSGWGVTSSSGRIEDVYKHTYGFGEDSPTWNFGSWTPDAVVMLIGPNDESMRAAAVAALQGNHSRGAVVEAVEVGTRGKSFIKAYLSLMTEVAGSYASAAVPPKLVHVCGGSINGLDPCPAPR